MNGLVRSVAHQLETHGFVARAGAPAGTDLAMSVPTVDGDREVHVQVSSNSTPGPAPTAAHHQAVTMIAEPYISARRGQSFRARDIPYIDTVGNMWLELPGLYILVEGRPAPPRLPSVVRGDRLSRPSSLRVTFALLTQPVLLQSTLRDLAAWCGTSVGATQAATADLVENGYLSPRSGARRLTRTGDLADRWVSDYGTRLLPKLAQASLRGPAPAWWIGSSRSLITAEASLGSEAACELLGYPLRAVETLVYSSPPWGPVRKLGRLTSEGDAPVTLRERFWSTGPDAPATAPSLLVYADLGLHDDPRLKQMSRQMRRDDDDLRRLWPA